VSRLKKHYHFCNLYSTLRSRNLICWPSLSYYNRYIPPLMLYSHSASIFLTCYLLVFYLYLYIYNCFMKNLQIKAISTACEHNLGYKTCDIILWWDKIVVYCPKVESEVQAEALRQLQSLAVYDFWTEVIPGRYENHQDMETRSGLKHWSSCKERPHMTFGQAGTKIIRIWKRGPRWGCEVAL
jgi:hypothetical protein